MNEIEKFNILKEVISEFVCEFFDGDDAQKDRETNNNERGHISSNHYDDFICILAKKIHEIDYSNASKNNNKLTRSDKLMHIYTMIHDRNCPNNEYMQENPEIHHDYSCSFLLDLIKFIDKNEK